MIVAALGTTTTSQSAFMWKPPSRTQGACRTASGDGGTFDVVWLQLDQACREACEAKPSCVAYEFVRMLVSVVVAKARLTSSVTCMNRKCELNSSSPAAGPSVIHATAPWHVRGWTLLRSQRHCRAFAFDGVQGQVKGYTRCEHHTEKVTHTVPVVSGRHDS